MIPEYVLSTFSFFHCPHGSYIHVIKSEAWGTGSKPLGRLGMGRVSLWKRFTNGSSAGSARALPVPPCKLEQLNKPMIGLLT